jgi:hypothetical protein
MTTCSAFAVTATAIKRLVKRAPRLAVALTIARIICIFVFDRIDLSSQSFIGTTGKNNTNPTTLKTRVAGAIARGFREECNIG